MNKRGQATVFIIIGIVILIIVALYIIGTQTKLGVQILGGGSAEDQLADIDDHISECLEETGTEYITKIALQGGYLSVPPNSYRLYNDTTVSYLCYNQPGTTACSNRLLTIAHMEQELEETISDALKACISVTDYSGDARTAEDWVLEVDILQQAVDLTLIYPIEVIKDEEKREQEEFSVTIPATLGELYDVSIDIVNDEAIVGDFDQLIYMLQKFSRYTIYKHKPYPDKIYQVKLREGNFIFQFAIQGEQTI